MLMCKSTDQQGIASQDVHVQRDGPEPFEHACCLLKSVRITKADSN